jgi:hypothetical protein
MTYNADLGREYAHVQTWARHPQILHVGGALAHREAGAFELTSRRDIRIVTAYIDEHLAERISLTTFAPIRPSVARCPSQYWAEPHNQYCRAQVSHGDQRAARLAQRVDVMGGAP